MPKKSAPAAPRSARGATRPTPPARPQRAVAEPSEVQRGVALRWQVVHLLLNDVVGERVTLEQLGEMLAEFLPPGTAPYHKATIYRMESGERGIQVDEMVALCDVCRKQGLEIDPGWLAFGDRSAAPEPMSGLVTRSRRLR